MSVTLSDTAAARVRGFIEQRGGGVGLRLGVRPSGCSGFAYVVDLADSVGGDDHVYESHGVKVVVDDRSLPLLDGTRVDFRREGLNETFVYDNPNVKSACGCGESIGF